MFIWLTGPDSKQVLVNYNLVTVVICGNPYGYFDKTLIRATMKVVDMRMEV